MATILNIGGDRPWDSRDAQPRESELPYHHPNGNFQKLRQDPLHLDILPFGEMPMPMPNRAVDRCKKCKNFFKPGELGDGRCVDCYDKSNFHWRKRAGKAGGQDQQGGEATHLLTS